MDLSELQYQADEKAAPMSDAPVQDFLTSAADTEARRMNESERLKAWTVNRIVELMAEECSDFNQDHMRELLSSLSMDNVLNQFHLTLVRRADRAMSENPIVIDCVQDADLNESEREELERLRDVVARLGGVLTAAEGLGAFPEGYCFGCFHRLPEGHHLPECLDMQRAIEIARGRLAEPDAGRTEGEV